MWLALLSAVRSTFLMFNIQILPGFTELLNDYPEPKIASNEFILWNVGQGQWATISTATNCYHFDMGGEVISWPKLQATCGKKLNFAFFSHWDMDHLSFAASANRNLQHFCVAAQPAGPCPSLSKFKLFSHLPRCIASYPEEIEEIFEFHPSSRNHPTSNDYSRVFEFSRWLVAQGDSPRREEKLWSKTLKSPAQIRILVLGHHGSRTSTSDKLLDSLPQLKIALSSARVARYGHPHSEVLLRLKSHGVACLRTEEWGNIHIQLPPKK